MRCFTLDLSHGDGSSSQSLSSSSEDDKLSAINYQQRRAFEHPRSYCYQNKCLTVHYHYPPPLKTMMRENYYSRHHPFLCSYRGNQSVFTKEGWRLVIIYSKAYGGSDGGRDETDLAWKGRHIGR
jgi:hypothetical protein